MGGDCIATHLVPLSTGIDMVKASIQAALGEKPDLKPGLKRGSAIRYLKEQHGTIQSVSGVEEARKMKGVREVFITKKIGDQVGEIGSSNDRIGAVIAQGMSAEEAVTFCKKAIKCIQITI